MKILLPWPHRPQTIVMLMTILVVNGGSAAAEETALTFHAAAERVLATNPRLAAAALDLESAAVREQAASLPPGFELDFELENALGTGDTRGFDEAEFTLSLGRILERGGKRDARRASAIAGTGVVRADTRIEVLDLLAETGRRFLAVAAAQEQERLLLLRLEQAARTATVVAERVANASSPRTEGLDAEIRAAEAELDAENVSRDLAAARDALAALWSARSEQPAVSIDLYALTEPRAFAELQPLLAALPDLERYAADGRLRAAEIQLARSQAVADWRWSLGVRHLEESGDQALVAGFAIPLGEARRAAFARREAELSGNRVALDHAQRSRELEALLFAHLQLLESAQRTADSIATKALPRALEARELLARGYRLGRFPYRELVQNDDRLAALESRRLAAALDYHAARIEIERLTGAHLYLLKD